MNPMQSPNVGTGKELSGNEPPFQDGVIVEVWEAYKADSQDCICARTKGLVRRFAFQMFGGFDTIGKARVFLSPEEQKTISNDGFVY